MKEVTSSLGALDSSLLCQSERTACRIIDGKAVVITIDQNQIFNLKDIRHVLSLAGSLHVLLNGAQRVESRRQRHINRHRVAQ